MFCAECGLEIKKKSNKMNGEYLCTSCYERQQRKPRAGISNDQHTISNELAQNHSEVYGDEINQSHTESFKAIGDNPFRNEDTYKAHVTVIRNKCIMPRFYIMLPAFFIGLMIIGNNSPLIFTVVFLAIFAIAIVSNYTKFFSYQPTMENYVIVQGLLKRRFLKSKNDDRYYTLIISRPVFQGHLLKTNQKSEIHLRGIRQQVKPYMGQNVTLHIDAKLELILLCKAD